MQQKTLSESRFIIQPHIVNISSAGGGIFQQFSGRPPFVQPGCSHARKNARAPPRARAAACPAAALLAECRRHGVREGMIELAGKPFRALQWIV